MCGEEIIKIDRVLKSYESPAGLFHALKGIDLSVVAGEFVAIVGKSGSGKSTLLNMITGIDRPSSGKVIVAGTLLNDFSESQMAVWRGKHIGIVFQFFQLLPTLSVVENIMLPMDFCNTYPKCERKDRAMHLLGLVDMEAQALKLPSALSGGQQQRVAIARSLANDPPILTADEPTGNLDSSTAEDIFTLFGKLVDQGKTIIMVTHDKELAMRAGRAVVVGDGMIINQPQEKLMGDR